MPYQPSVEKILLDEINLETNTRSICNEETAYLPSLAGIFTLTLCLLGSGALWKRLQWYCQSQRDIVWSDTMFIGYKSAVAHTKSQKQGLIMPVLDKIKPAKLSTWMGRGSWCPISLWEGMSSWWLLGENHCLSDCGLWGYPCSHITA